MTTLYILSVLAELFPPPKQSYAVAPQENSYAVAPPVLVATTTTTTEAPEGYAQPASIGSRPPPPPILNVRPPAVEHSGY